MKKDHVKLTTSKTSAFIVPNESGTQCSINDEKGRHLLDVKTNKIGTLTVLLPRKGTLSVYCDGEYVVKNAIFESLQEVETLLIAYFQQDNDFIVPDENSNDSTTTTTEEEPSTGIESEYEPWEHSDEYEDGDEIEYIDESSSETARPISKKRTR